MKHLVFAALLAAANLASAATSAPLIVSLVPPGALQVLDAKDLLDDLCPPKNGKADLVCRKEKMASKVYNLSLYEAPSLDAKKTGRIVLTVTPGKGIVAQFIDDKNKSITFDSDSNGNWNYNSYFEFSVKESKGDWVLLPKRPFASDVWINRKSEWSSKSEALPVPEKIKPGMYSSKTLGDIVITRLTAAAVTYRMENANDMGCGEPPVKITPAQLKTWTKPLDVLFDADGHLTAWNAHPEGC